MKCFNRNGEFKVTTSTLQYLFEGAPKVLDETDGLWRYLRSTNVGGVPSLFLSQTADTTPGREAIVQDETDGAYRKVRSVHVGGVPTIYLEDYP